MSIEPGFADAGLPAYSEVGDVAGQETQPQLLDVPVEVTTESVAYEGMRNRPSGPVAAAAADEELQTWNVGGRSDSDHVSNRPTYHPGTRVRVDARPKLGARFLRSRDGTRFAQRMVAALRNHGYWRFRNCFEDVARYRHDLGGKTELLLTVDGGGNVRQARLLKTELKQRSIALCHAAEARRLRLEPNRMRRIDVDVTVAVWPGDVPLLPLPAQKTQVNSGCEAIEGATRAIGRIESDIVRCMQLARQKDPRLWGRLALSFFVDPSGRPGQITQFQSQFGDADAVQCVASHLQTLEFAPSGPQCHRLAAAWRLHRSAAMVRSESEGSATNSKLIEAEPTPPVSESPSTDAGVTPISKGTESALPKVSPTR